MATYQNIDLRYGLGTARDLYAKMLRDAARLDRQVTSDDFFNFLVTAYSLADWITNDPSVPQSAKQDSDGSKHQGMEILLLCGELANGSKHFLLTKNKPTAASKVTSSTGWGVGRYGIGPYGIGEEGIVIEMSDGTFRNCLDFVGQVVRFWEAFFTKHHIS